MTRDILLNDILSDEAGKSSVHGAWWVESHSWHVDIQVDMCMLHLDVCLIMRPLHVHLGGE